MTENGDLVIDGVVFSFRLIRGGKSVLFETQINGNKVLYHMRIKKTKMLADMKAYDLEIKNELRKFYKRMSEKYEM